VKVLIVNGRKINSFALTLECATHYSRQGHDVQLVNLDLTALPFSRKNKALKTILYRNRVNQPKSGLLRTLKNFTKASQLSYEWYQLALQSSDPWDVKLKSIEIPIGRLVKSLIARNMGSSQFSLVDCPQLQVNEIATKAIFSYLQTSDAIQNSSTKLDLGIAHGGRDAYSAGAFVAFDQRGIKVNLVEAGGVPIRWSLFENSPHYAPDFWSRMECTPDKPFDQQLVKQWWESRLAGSDHFASKEWGSSRVSGLLPKNLPQKFITFFTTSDFEIPVFRKFDFSPSAYKNQFEAFDNLWNAAQKSGEHIVIRRHPNSLDVNGFDRESSLWEEVKNLPGVTYIGPHEKIDSILLAKSSSKVFTFRSSVGIEAIWLGVPSYAMGAARWAWTGELRVWNNERLIEVLSREQNSNPSHAIRWANMMITMDFDNIEFREIHGNFAKRSSETVRNTKLADRIDRLFVSLLWKMKNRKSFKEVQSC
jgi:hypothetical protein